MVERCDHRPWHPGNGDGNRSFEIDWEKFEAWLSKGFVRSTVKDRLCYAQKYAHMVDGSLSELVTMKKTKQQHALKARAVKFRRQVLH